MKHAARLSIAALLAVCVFGGCATVEEQVKAVQQGVADLLYGKRDWDRAKTADTIQAYEVFLEQHPKSEFAETARARLAQLYLARDWQQAKTADTIQAYEHFLQHHASSHLAETAKARLVRLRLKRDWDETTATNDIPSYEKFLQRHPSSDFTADARSRLQRLRVGLDWERTKAADTIATYEEFLGRYPESNFSAEARSRLQLLRRDHKRWQQVQGEGSLQAYRDFVGRVPDSPYAGQARAILRDMEGRDIVDLLRENKIDVASTGDGIRRVSLKIRRLVNHNLTVRIPVGTFFVSRKASAQNMVATEGLTVTIDTDAPVGASVAVACANRGRDIPGGQDSFAIERSPQQAELAQLMPVLDRARVGFAVRQAAIWIVTDDATYEHLGILVNRPAFQPFGGTRVIGADDTAAAMKLAEEAGVNIARKAIWRDRRRIFEESKDGDLKSWLGKRLTLETGNVQRTHSFEIRVVKAGNAKIKPDQQQYERMQLTGVILEIKSLVPDTRASLHPGAIKARSSTGESIPAIVVFSSGRINNVNESISFGGRSTLRNWRILINDEEVKINKLGNTGASMIMTLESGGSHPSYAFERNGLVEVGFIFAEDLKNIAGISLLGIAIELKSSR